MRKRSDNRGFTLVEIIIAVAILAIAIIPLTANFIQSSKLNMKGRQTLNAMNLAQDMMEGISGSTAEEVETILDNYIADPATAPSLAGTIFPASTTFGTPSKTSAPGDDVLVYQFADVKTVDSPKNEYTVKMTMDPTGSAHTEFNGKELANISEINKYYDAIYTWDDKELDTIVGEMYNKSSNTSYQKSDYYGKIKRTIRIDIKNINTETDPKYQISVVREYTPTAELIGDANLPADTMIPKTTNNISRMDEDKLPRSVYLYYQGMKNSSQTSRLDTIEINSNTGEEITVYLVRTQSEEDENRGSYGINYGCTVKINSKDMMTNPTYDVHIVSNLRYDLNATNMRYNFRDVDETGAALPPEQIEYPLSDDGKTQITTSTYDRNRAEYMYNGATLTEAVYQTNFSAGFSKNEKNTLYKILIEVFDKNGTKVATYDGGLYN